MPARRTLARLLGTVMLAVTVLVMHSLATSGHRPVRLGTDHRLESAMAVVGLDSAHEAGDLPAGVHIEQVCLWVLGASLAGIVLVRTWGRAGTVALRPPSVSIRPVRGLGPAPPATSPHLSLGVLLR